MKQARQNPRIHSEKPRLSARRCLYAFVYSGLLLVLLPATSDGVTHSKFGFFNNSVGLLRWNNGLQTWRGSGCVAWDPRLVFTCAHVLYENGWAQGGYTFHPGYHDRNFPPFGGVFMRGYHYFSNYSGNVRRFGQRSRQAYDSDLLVLYGFTDVGDAMGAWHDGGSQLRSNYWKLIAGYPSKVDFTGQNGFSYQHSTDYFSRSSSTRYRSYHVFDAVSTGSGNSGGPVFVVNPADSLPYLAGVLVAGTSTTAGVRALDASSKSMAEAALRGTTRTQSYSNKSAFVLPDGASRFSLRAVQVTGFTSNLSALRCSVQITTPRRADLDVYLKSPVGRVHLINKQGQGGKAQNLAVKNADYTKHFSGNPNGSWTLHMRDAAKRNRATFKSFSVTASSR